jgi:hypothetical protein
LSYCIAFLLTTPSVCLGLYALNINGVAHSTYFSAIIAMTRNPGLDVLPNRGNTFSLDSETSNPSLRFGEDNVGMKGERAALGMADEVTELKKDKFYREPYISNH